MGVGWIRLLSTNYGNTFSNSSFVIEMYLKSVSISVRIWFYIVEIQNYTLKNCEFVIISWEKAWIADYLTSNC